MSKLARALTLAAMVAAMSLAPLTAVAETHATDHATSQDAKHPAAQRRVTAPQQAADAAHRRLLAQERSLTPTGATAQLPDPMRPAEPGWLTPALAALVVLALAAGVAVMAVRRANRGQRAGQTA